MELVSKRKCLFSPALFCGSNLLLVFGVTSNTCWSVATCPPRIPFLASCSSLPQFFHRSDLGNPPQEPCFTCFSLCPSVRLAASLLPSLFNMWRSGVCLPSCSLPNSSFSQRACYSREKIILLLAPRVSVMQFSSSPGFIHTATSSTLLSAHIAPSHTFARSCGMRPPGRLQTERPCIGGVHSCPRTCLPDTSRQFLFLTHHLLHDCRTSAFPQSSQKFKCSITWHRNPPLTLPGASLCQSLARKHLEITPTGR